MVIAIRELLKDTPLRSERLAVASQRTVGEAFRTLGALQAAGAVERLLDGSRSFRLTAEARARLGSRVAYSRSTLEEHASLVLAYLDQHTDVSRQQAAQLLDLEPKTATRVLGQLLERGVLEYSGPSRGRSVRYRLPRA